MAVLTGDLLREGLREFLEGPVSETLGRTMVPSGILWTRRESESSYQTWLITLIFPDQPVVKVFLKDYGSVRQAKEDLESRRERELHVYSNLLPASGLGTARCYGSVRDHSGGRYWLFLEFVEATPLKYLDFEYWPRAAAWLGRLAGHFARSPERLKQGGHLIEHDARFFLSTAERAVRSVRKLVPRLAGGLEAILGRYEGLARRMASQPKTLVHGAYRPEQILVDGVREPARFCPVDWELAAIGSSLYDLAFFADGFKAPRLDLVLDAYREEAVKHGVPVPPADELNHLIDSFRLHRVFNWLGHALERKYPEKDLLKLTRMATDFADSLLSSGLDRNDLPKARIS